MWSSRESKTTLPMSNKTLLQGHTGWENLHAITPMFISKPLYDIKRIRYGFDYKAIIYREII